MAYQVAFDLSANQNQPFLLRIVSALPTPALPAAAAPAAAPLPVRVFCNTPLPPNCKCLFFYGNSASVDF